MFAELERTLEHKFRSYYKHKDRILAEFENRTLENPIEPQAHIFVKDKDPWIEISRKDICHEKMYDREKTWPKESLERI